MAHSHLFRLFPAFRSAVILFAAWLTPLNCVAQQPKVLAPHRPIPPRALDSRVQQRPATPRSMVGGLWMVDPNRKASIYLKNGLETSALTVTPVLFLGNGSRHPMSPVTLEPSGTAVVSINDALEKMGIAPYASLSGYVEVDYNWAWDPLCLSVTSSDPIHSVIFTYGFQPSAISNLPLRMPKVLDGMNAVEGMWWKQEANASGFVALSNTSTATADVRVQVTDSENQFLGEESIRVSPHGTKIVDLTELQQARAGAVGGLRILYSGSGDAMLINGGLEDDVAGYSANLPFHFVAAPESTDAAQLAQETYSELGLMTGAAEPLMSFPAGTTFTPFSVARNVGDQPVSVTPTLYWMQGGAARSTRLSSFVLAPFQARNLDVASLLAGAGLSAFNGSVNLILDAQGQSQSLLLASGSVDKKNTYVFQVTPRGVQESEAKNISYWSTANGDDTMVTVWNPADEEQGFMFTLLYTGGQYKLPVHLDARATRAFNISEIIQDQIPDLDGNVVPLTVREGSAKLTGINADNEAILVALDAGTYNVRKATCSYYCISCDGTVYAYTVLNPFALAKGGQTTLTLMGQQNTGGTYSLGGTWSSNNTTVATVGSSSGTVSGVNIGSVTISAFISTSVYNSYYCAYNAFCPAYGSVSGSSSGTVLQLSLTPGVLNMSSGDQGLTIKLTISPSSASVLPTFSTGLSQNPNSSSTASVTVTNPSGNVSGSYNAPIRASGTNSPSGEFTILAVANGVSSNTADLTVPPQILIQMIEAEAGGTNVTTMTAVGEVVRNRFSSPLFNTQYTTYQNAIVPGQFAASSTTTGIDPELGIASSVFAGVSAGNFCGSLAFWTPTASQWQTVQTALQSGTATFPANTGSPVYSTWTTSQQQILFVPAVGTNTQGVPYFLFLTQRNSSQAAAINTSCN